MAARSADSFHTHGSGPALRISRMYWKMAMISVTSDYYQYHPLLQLQSPVLLATTSYHHQVLLVTPVTISHAPGSKSSATRALLPGTFGSSRALLHLEEQVEHEVFLRKSLLSERDGNVERRPCLTYPSYSPFHRTDVSYSPIHYSPTFPETLNPKN